MIANQVLGLEAATPKEAMTRTEALNTFDRLWAQAVELLDMTLDEINVEIAVARAERIC